jgi:hypothetical protein
MDDLVQRLRSYVICYDEYEPAEQIMREAADEIERLRAAVKTMSEHGALRRAK